VISHRKTTFADSLVERLTHGGDHHCQRWGLHIPVPGESVREVRPLLFVLGLPTFGLALAISVATTFGPVILIRLVQSTTTVGALIGAEGAFALVVPLVAGSLSDRLPASSFGRRLPFVLAGAPLTVAGLVLLPFSPTIALAGLAVLAFFIGYYVYYPPYRALYADLLPRTLYARAQAWQAIARGAGLGLALLAGGLLLSVWRPLVFLVAAAVVVVTTVALLPVFELQNQCGNRALPYGAMSLRELVLGNGKLRMFAVVNSLWEFSFAGLKTFIVLFIVRGLGHSAAVASAVIAVVAVAYIAGAPIAGWLADRYGIVRTLRWTSIVYGVGLLFGAIPDTLPPLLVGLPFIALAGAIVLTLPQALAFTLAPEGSEGAAAGLQDFSRGVGVVLGPVAVGAAVAAAQGIFPATHGYSAMWIVIGLPVLIAAHLLSRAPFATVSTAVQQPTTEAR
jgi:MFS family permease